MMTRIAKNLYLQDMKGAKSWIFRYTSPITGKRRHMGLGPCDLVSEQEAIQTAQTLRKSVFFGSDPLGSNA